MCKHLFLVCVSPYVGSTGVFGNLIGGGSMTFCRYSSAPRKVISRTFLRLLFLAGVLLGGLFTCFPLFSQASQAPFKSKLWKFKERFSARFRVEFFNLFNRADFSIPGSGGTQATGGTDPSAVQFGCACVTPDNANPVLGSGGPRHIQFGLKLTY
jgi:hypothetical protein